MPKTIPNPSIGRIVHCVLPGHPPAEPPVAGVITRVHHAGAVSVVNIRFFKDQDFDGLMPESASSVRLYETEEIGHSLSDGHFAFWPPHVPPITVE